MPVLYKTIQSTMKNKDGNKLFHPRTIYVGSVNTEKIAREPGYRTDQTSAIIRSGDAGRLRHIPGCHEIKG